MQAKHGTHLLLNASFPMPLKHFIRKIRFIKMSILLAFDVKSEIGSVRSENLKYNL